MQLFCALWCLLAIVLIASSLDAQVLWQENFNYPNGTTAAGDNNPPAGTDWTLSCPGCICCNDWFEVRNNKLEGRDTNGPAVWTSEAIDISSCAGGVGFMMDLSYTGPLEACTAGCGCNCIDWIQVEYSLDGGAFTSLSSGSGGTCSQSCGTGTFATLGTFTPFSFYGPCPLTGSTLVLRVSLQTWAGNEYLQFDRVSVMCNSCSPLPVELASFTGKPNGQDVVLDWITLSEHNTDYFEILASVDGLHFAPAGTVKANGRSVTSNIYQFTDHAPQSGINYYRLLTHDLDGSTDSSGLISVQSNASGAVPLGVYPNPGMNRLILRSPWPDGQGLYYQITDQTGRVLSEGGFDGPLKKIATDGLSSGIYIILLYNNGKIASAKWVRQ